MANGAIEKVYNKLCVVQGNGPTISFCQDAVCWEKSVRGSLSRSREHAFLTEGTAEISSSLCGCIPEAASCPV
jgi:hypothetical protein